MGRRGWYAVPAVLLLVGVVLIVVGAVSVGRHNAFALQPLDNGGSVQAGSDGFGVYSSSPPLSPATCTAVGSGGTSVRLTPPSGTVTVTRDSQSYVQIARTPDGFTAGTYTVSCPGTVGSLATGARGIGGTIAGIFLIIGGVIVVVIALVVLLVVFLVLRSRRNRPPGGGPGPAGSYRGPPRYQQPRAYGQPVQQPPPYSQQPPGYGPPYSG